MRHDTALIDAPCANLLRRHLEDVAKIAGDITLTVARLDRVNRGHGPQEDLGWWKADNALEAIPMPVDFDKARRHDAAVGELGTWARHIASERGLPVYGSSHRDHPLKVLAEWIAGQLEWLRHRPEADEAWPALLSACVELVRVVDTRLPGELVGMCACGTARYSTEGTCPRCRAEDLAYNRADLDAGRDDLLVTATEAARYVADSGLILGTKGSTDRLRKLIWAWADRGHLTPVDEVPRYRLGDVLKRVLDSPALLRAA